ncbi:MAG: hypothetical protein HQL56_01665 [Magnetococcales bacterium]|nr:hypothetical protein [Magnetococcales bacterium]
MNTLSFKLYFTFGANLVLLALLAWFSFEQFATRQEQIRRLTSFHMPLLQTLSRLESTLFELSHDFASPRPASTEGFLMFHDEDLFREEIKHLHLDTREAMALVTHHVYEIGNLAEFDKLKQAVAWIRTTEEAWATHLEKHLIRGPTDKETCFPREQEQAIRNGLHTLTKAVLDAVDEGERQVAHWSAAQKEVQTRFTFAVAAVWLLCLASGIALFLYLHRSVQLPLRQMSAACRRLATGEAHLESLPNHAALEVGQMLTSLQILIRSLRERRDVEQLALRKERLSSSGRLACGLAHEINNPLANAAMNLQLMRSQLPAEAGPELHSRLEVVERNINKAIALSRELLSFSRAETEDGGPVSLDEVLEGALTLLEFKLSPFVVHKALIEENLLLHGIFAKLEQLFVNLLQNAADASPPGSELAIAGHREGDWVVVEVRDHGPGIPPELRYQVLEPFFTTKGDEGHFGLGLTICQSIMTGCGGSISFEEPSPGPGLLVRLRFPTPVGNHSLAGEIGL